MLFPQPLQCRILYLPCETFYAIPPLLTDTDITVFLLLPGKSSNRPTETAVLWPSHSWPQTLYSKHTAVQTPLHQQSEQFLSSSLQYISLRAPELDNLASTGEEMIWKLKGTRYKIYQGCSWIFRWCNVRLVDHKLIAERQVRRK